MDTRHKNDKPQNGTSQPQSGTSPPQNGTSQPQSGTSQPQNGTRLKCDACGSVNNLKVMVEPEFTCLFSYD